MVDWKKVKCTHCDSKKQCRKKNISKGSMICQVNLKIREPKEDKNVSKQAAASAMLYSMVKGAKKGKVDEDE